VANYAGAATTAVLGLALAPIYIRLLGPEGYGLIGFYIAVSVVCSVFDFGLSTTANRQLAATSPNTPARLEARDLLRTIEILYLLIGLMLGVLVWASATLIARHWFQAQALSATSISSAVQWMGVAIALQWPTQLYAASLLGMQQHVPLNTIRIAFVILQAIGSVSLLSNVSATPAMFFFWQSLTCGGLSIGLYIIASRKFATAPLPPRPRLRRLLEHKKFAVGLTGITAASIVLTQVDKLIISRTLPLEALGHYTLASMVAAGIAYIASPISATLFPRLVGHATQSTEFQLAAIYHAGCQLTALIVLPIACCIVAFADVLLLLWLRDESIADRVAPLVKLLVAGTTLNSLVLLAYHLQIAHGWTRLSLLKNVFAISVLIPITFWMIHLLGAVGAALVWLALNVGYFAIEIPIMHRQILPGHTARWYLEDNLIPLSVSAGITAIGRAALPPGLPAIPEIAWIICTYLVAVAAVLLALPKLRRQAVLGLSRS
jgi:O-antigen/teichoic acid export membrane protein